MKGARLHEDHEEDVQADDLPAAPHRLRLGRDQPEAGVPVGPGVGGATPSAEAVRRVRRVAHGSARARERRAPDREDRLEGVAVVRVAAEDRVLQQEVRAEAEAEGDDDEEHEERDDGLYGLDGDIEQRGEAEEATKEEEGAHVCSGREPSSRG